MTFLPKQSAVVRSTVLVADMEELGLAYFRRIPERFMRHCPPCGPEPVNRGSALIPYSRHKFHRNLAADRAIAEAEHIIVEMGQSLEAFNQLRR